MSQQEIDQLVDQDYKYGFVTDIESDTLPPGLNEDVIREISTRKGEPAWLLEWRLDAYKKWLEMAPPEWAHLEYPPIDFQSISYFSAPKKQGDGPKSLDEVDPALIETYNKLGIPLEEQKMLAGVAVDAVFDSVSVVTTFKEKLHEAGVVFCPLSEAVHSHPELVKKILGFGRSSERQLLRRTELSCLLRRIICLYPERRSLPDGALDLLQNQPTKYRSI